MPFQHTYGLTHANGVADHPDGEVVGILPQISRAELVILGPEDNRHSHQITKQHVCVCMKVLRVAYTTSVSLIQVYYGSSQIQEEARGFAEAATLLSFLQFTLFMFPP